MILYDAHTIAYLIEAGSVESCAVDGDRLVLTLKNGIVFLRIEHVEENP